MAGLVPAIHAFLLAFVKTWMPATSAGMTTLAISGTPYFISGTPYLTPGIGRKGYFGDAILNSRDRQKRERVNTENTENTEGHREEPFVRA
jgi:hypothetical protein